jgi:Holliday junction resolvase RusA-like endonuclease
VIGISLTSIVQVKSEAHDKELYQKFKQDIDNEVGDMRDLLRQHIMLSDREEQLKPSKLVIVNCRELYQERLICNSYPRHHIYLHLITV